MIEALREKLQAEVKALNHELHVTLPQTLKKALELGDLRENSDYQAAIERQGIIAARLEHLRSRLHKLSDIDLSKVPADRVGLGSRVTVMDMGTKEEVVYELVIPDAVELEDGHISVSSPLGSAFLDRKAKDSVSVVLPAGTRKFKILKVETLHDLAKEMATE
jgi:transcription elongation factor GreA